MSFYPSKKINSILTSHTLSYCMTIALGLKWLLCKGGIYNLKIKPLPESEKQPTPRSLLGCAKTSRQVGWILPQPVIY